jgi:light-regulated signal transduction histidine kinase (bacteriophytochrome)/CheY-like chemotaxis protein
MQPKILLVDDREDNLLSIETILESDGYIFVKANSGRQALKILLTEFDFALILMDVKMPNLNGFETAALIYERERLKHIPIIFITANSYGDENVFKGYRTGAVDYIYKPINPELLRAKVGVFVDLYKKNHRLLAQERKLVAINTSLELEINERKISEQKVKDLNQQLLENIARLESANKELDRFAFMASHDLQEPLRKMLMFSDRLSVKFKDILDEDARNYISKIQNAGKRMKALVEDILTFSKLSMEKDSFVYSDLNQLLSDVLSDMEETIKEKKARVIVEELPGLYVNPGLIRPLFYNLISNALKYSKNDVPPVVRIHSEGPSLNGHAEPEDENKYCRIMVQDNGIGFEQQYSEHIFGMFKRLHLKNKYEGTGIGLALCKKIVEEHNGYISAISKVGEGSTFIVSLPMKQPVLSESLADQQNE